MSRKLKVAEDRQLVTSDGMVHVAGESFATSDDDHEVDRWVAAGWAEDKGGKRSKSKPEPMEHFVALERGLDPAGLEGRD